MHIWTLRKGADRRFRTGHPWIYSNELADSPKGIAPGDPVEVRDANGGFLARGYGHPGTLIAFRALGRDLEETEPCGDAGVLLRLRRAWALRRALGLGGVSHRLCFGEADDLPGLVVDRYRLHEAGTAAGQVFVLQAHTAGAERLVPAVVAGLERLVAEEAETAGPGWKQSGVVLRNDLALRALEGLAADEVRVLRPLPGVDPADLALAVPAPLDGAPARLHADLLGGQKTGLFLDQAHNVQLAARLLAARLAADGAGAEPVRILDLFAYVGQWGAHLADVARIRGRTVAVTAVDTSAAALDFARRNMEVRGAAFAGLRMDILRDLPRWTPDGPDEGYDVVVADPPAFIKRRKDLHTGRAAYVKLNTAALRLVRPGGLYVACSCSALLDDAEFLAGLGRAARRTGREVAWLAQGGQAPDHPVLAAFPEGRYLKCWIGRVR